MFCWIVGDCLVDRRVMAIDRFFSGCPQHKEYHYGCNACLIATVGKIAHFLDDQFPEEEKPMINIDQSHMVEHIEEV